MELGVSVHFTHTQVPGTALGSPRGHFPCISVVSPSFLISPSQALPSAWLSPALDLFPFIILAGAELH